uniref:Carboxylic ester hydrolase n=1 Tax=Latimeria chalumnae TaxID=7897 RepID=H3A410_LATCH
ILPGCSELIRQTSTGLVLGRLEEWDNKTVECYLGIPYAAPPLNSLRFHPPQPHPGWNETFNATTFEPMCIQEFAAPGQDFGQEDCLRVNIYVPYNSISDGTTRLLPVMVFIHGGAFVIGSGNYKAHILAELGQVIVITMNYRLGVFGFLSTGDSAALGNFGLLDQRFAISWVKASINSFGGNPNSITVFGESAGAASVMLQYLSPLNTGLFQRAISEGGAAIATWTIQPEDPAFFAKKLARFLHCPTNGSHILVDCLQVKKPAELMYGVSRLKEFNFTFLPTVDGLFLPDSPRKLSKNASLVGRFSYLMGANRNEGSFLWLQIKTVRSQADFVNVLKPFISVAEEKFSLLSEAMLWQYRNWNDLNYSSYHIQRQALEAVGDVGFIAPLVATAEFIVDARRDVYVYHFTRRPIASITPEWMGAGHGDELVFVFGVSLLGGPLQGDEEHILSQQIMSYWTNFAKSGNPNFPNKVPVIWPKYNKRSQQYLQLDINLSSKNVRKKLKAEHVAFWNQYLPVLQTTGD